MNIGVFSLMQWLEGRSAERVFRDEIAHSTLSRYFPEVRERG